jgi:hypothetical protein
MTMRSKIAGTLAVGAMATVLSVVHYLTARLAGGQVVDTFNSNATQVGSWEKFTLVCGPEIE